jgi:predicted RNase H-like HicB family nuclease
MREYKYTVIFEPDLESGGWVATVPVLGLATQGESLPETRRMVREAISGYIEGLRSEGQPIPPEPSRLVSRIRTERIAIKI